MALRFCDSFDHWLAADVNLKWTSSARAQLTTGRFGSGYFMTQVTSPGGSLMKQIDSQQTWVVGYALKYTGISGTAPAHLIIRDNGTNQVYLSLVNGYLYLYNGSGTVLGTSTTLLQAGVWYHAELKVKIDNTTGTYELRLNEVTQFSGTSADTQNSANATANQIYFQGSNNDNSSHSFVIDDVVVCDGTGGVNDDFRGDCRVESLYPNGNGNSSVLVGSDGNSTDNYLLVDDTTPNDADYVESSTPGDKDTYAYTNLTSASGTVHGVQMAPRAAKTDAGTRSIVSVARLSATEVDGPVQTLSTTPTWYFDIRQTKPGGGSWTVSDVNSAEFGVKINA